MLNRVQKSLSIEPENCMLALQCKNSFSAEIWESSMSILLNLLYIFVTVTSSVLATISQACNGSPLGKLFSNMILLLERKQEVK